MTASSTPPLHILRGILRIIRRSHVNWITSSNNTNSKAGAISAPQIHNHILELYRNSRSSPPEKIHILRKLAFDFYTLQKDLAERARLYELDSGAENVFTPQELSRRAAARSGLKLPKLFEEDTK
jgi:hypothetical protein